MKIASIFILGLLFSLVPLTTVADTPAPDPNAGVSGGSINNPLTNTATLEGLITTIMQAIVQIGAVFLVLALIYVGFLFTTAQGNEEKIKTARHALFWTVIGGLVLLGAEVIAQVVARTAAEL